MSVIFEKSFDWAILPSQCFVRFTDNPCITLKNPRTILLYPSKINYISLGFQMKMPYGFTFQIKTPFRNKFWQILSDYLNVPVLDNLPVSIPVITSCETYLYPGDILTHLQLLPICLIPPFLAGKTIFNF